MEKCVVCEKPESEWPTINKGGKVCSENCKKELAENHVVLNRMNGMDV